MSGVCLLLSFTQARAGREEGVAAYERGEYEAAFQELEPIAQSGAAQAIHYVGLMYETGQGVAANPSTAWSWYNRAAERGHAASMYRIGLMYERGLGVPLRPKEAQSWFLKSAYKGYPKAMVAVAMTYLNGRGVRPDLNRAKEWLEKASLEGEPDAQAVLDRLAAEGRIRISPPPGETDPTDPETRKVLIDVKAILQPYLSGALGTRLSLSGPPTIARSGESFVIYLPGLTQVGDPRAGTGDTQLGTVRLGAKPEGEGFYRFSPGLPSRVVTLDPQGKPLSTVTFGSQNIDFLWSMKEGTALDGTFSFTDVGLNGSEGASAGKIAAVKGRLSTERAATGHLSATESLTLSGLSIPAATPGGSEVRLGSLTLEGGVSGMDMTRYQEALRKAGIDWERGTASPDALARLFSADGPFPMVFSGLSFSSRFENLSIGGPNDALSGALKSAELSFSLEKMDTDAGQVRLTLGMAGLSTTTGDLGPLTPNKASGTVTLTGLPVQALMKEMAATVLAGLAATPQMASQGGNAPVDSARIVEVLSASDLGMTVDRIEVAGQGYDVTATGAFKFLPGAATNPAAPLNAEGNLLVQVRGLESLIAGLSPPGGDPAAPNPGQNLKDIAEVSTDAEGKTLHTFRVKLLPGGQVLVNERSLDTLFAPPSTP